MSDAFFITTKTRQGSSILDSIVWVAGWALPTPYHNFYEPRLYAQPYSSCPFRTDATDSRLDEKDKNSGGTINSDLDLRSPSPFLVIHCEAV